MVVAEVVVVVVVVDVDSLLVMVVLVLDDVVMYPEEHSVLTIGLFTSKPFLVPNSHPCQEL